MFHYRLTVKFDTHRNLQRHRAVLNAIARLSCLQTEKNISALFITVFAADDYRPIQ